mgnify:FL=1|jgi:hypothetical protein
MNAFETADGGYQIEIKGRTMVLTIKGVMDVEVALRLLLEARLLLIDLPHEHWASLLDLTEWGLHPPEIIEFVREFQVWAEENGQLAEAAVINKSVLKVMVRNSLLEGTRKTVHQEYFDNKNGAIEWLRILSLYED